jgi:hypothetical protein
MRAWIRTYPRLAALSALLVIGFLAALILPTLQSPPLYRTVDVIETLNNPVVVIASDEHGLLLADGRRIGLPGVSRIPATSMALDRATAAGVEITPDGRVVGLLRVLHWCGNDSVRSHVARVDLAYLLMFLGETDVDPEKLNLLGERTRDGHFSFSDFGWRVGDFREFEEWSKLAGTHGL